MQNVWGHLEIDFTSLELWTQWITTLNIFSSVLPLSLSWLGMNVVNMFPWEISGSWHYADSSERDYYLSRSWRALDTPCIDTRRPCQIGTSRLTPQLHHDSILKCEAIVNWWQVCLASEPGRGRWRHRNHWHLAWPAAIIACWRLQRWHSWLGGQQTLNTVLRFVNWRARTSVTKRVLAGINARIVISGCCILIFAG